MMDVELSIEEIVGPTPDGVCVVVRSLAGRLRPGCRLTDRERSQSPVWTVARMWRYERDVDLVDPPHTAMLELTGSGAAGLTPGTHLVEVGTL